MQRPDTQSLTCVECERTWERPRQGGRPPRRCPSCVQGAAPSSPPPAARPTSTGVACRVCGVDDGEERAQPDLHLACVERATDRALKRKATRVANRVARAGGEISRGELLRRLAEERGLAAPSPGKRGRGRPPRARLEQDEHAEDEEAGLTADEVEHIEMITRGGGLATEGLE